MQHVIAFSPTSAERPVSAFLGSSFVVGISGLGGAAALRRRYVFSWRLRARDHLAERTLTRIFRFRGYGVSAQPQLLPTKTLSIFVKLDAPRRFARQGWRET